MLDTKLNLIYIAVFSVMVLTIVVLGIVWDTHKAVVNTRLDTEPCEASIIIQTQTSLSALDMIEIELADVSI